MPGLSEGKTFSSFGDLKKEYVPPEETNQEMFERLLKNNMDAVPTGSFLVKREPLTSVTLIPHRQEGKDENPVNQVFATAFYRRPDGKEGHFTTTIYADGQIGGHIPAEAKVSRMEILNQVLKTIERLNIKFWRAIDGPIVGDHDEYGPREEEVMVAGRPDKKREIDPERVEFMEKLPGAVFGFYNRKLGFNGYRGLFVDRDNGLCIVLEHPREGNAMYVLPLRESLELTDDQIAKVQSSETEQDKIIERIWYPIRDQAPTRGSLVSLGAHKVTHHGNNWPERAAAAIREATPISENTE